ncbi:hypothetical protein [Acinetobacter sp. MD2(2019)]|uniref:hypothetical protein n=1 Tax=Acinetobacter sp. MD2(2019) TaxID=2605273 RepID=UPI002D1F6C46|nr:hypothetical protein [Acinetobacter sp. MD2(2019)]MEB3753451.1 hypothetical protein [Acinetobacter sp. MD2(2019)]
MNTTLKLMSFALFAAGLSACQNMPQSYNGNSGYKVESQSSNSAIISYTLAVHANQNVNTTKLENVCKRVLGSNQNYKVDILSSSEIINPASLPQQSGVQIGSSNATFGLSNTSSNDNVTLRNTMQTHPSTLTVVRYRCSS